MSHNNQDSLGRFYEAAKAPKRLHEQHDTSFLTSFQVGMDMFMQPLGRSDKDKWKTKLLGYLRGEYLILMTPRINGMLVNYGGQNQMAVRYMCEGSVFGFQTTIFRTIGSPLNLTFLKYPSRIEEISLRRSPRIQMVIPFRLNDSQDSGNTILNLSSSGALVQMVDPPRIEESIRLSFTLPNGKAIDNLECVVKRVDMNTKRILVGLQFEENSENAKAIAEYIEMVIQTLGEPIG